MTSYIIIGLIALAAIIYFVYQWWKSNADDKVHRIPLLRILGFWDLPAIPIILKEIPQTLKKLSDREKEIEPAKNGLSNTYTIDGKTETGRTFMYGQAESNAAHEARSKLGEIIEKSKMIYLIADKFFGDRLDQKDASDDEPDIDPLTILSLEKPSQFRMAWTTFEDVYKKAEPFASNWEKSLSDADIATKQFWPTIAQNGLAYNLLIIEKIGAERFKVIKNKYSDDCTQEMQDLADKGLLYLIDMTIFSTTDSPNVDDIPRFTPSTFSLLKQEEESKNLIPFAIWVAAENEAKQQFYDRSTASDSAWLYSLQAAKVSITVWGIWIGHVYHWHIVPGALQMSMYNTFPESHVLYKLMEPQSNYLIAFDNVLLLLWRFTAPPTAIATSKRFLELTNTYSKGRTYFDDDPKTTLDNLGIKEADFTFHEPWDKYVLVKHLLSVWDAVETYITSIVHTTYQDDAAISADLVLQNWIKDATDKKEGNIQGLPNMNNRKALINVLTSFIYRITVHGISRQNQAANPGLTFVSNFPPTLHKTNIPPADATMSTTELLQYLPNTGTIGKMIKFYFTFVFSTPYESFVPHAGPATDLFFPGGENAPLNQALINFREAIVEFIKDFEEGDLEIEQWPLNVET